MRIDRIVAVLAVLMVAGAAQAQDAAPTAPASNDQRGLEIGVRTGFAFALGKAAGDGTSSIDYSMSSLTPGQIPLQLDVAYRINRRFAAGAYFSYGLVPLHQDYACGSDTTSCSGSDLRVGIQGQFHPFVDLQGIDPWVGLGFGYERLHFSATDSGGTSSLDFSGLEFANLAIGGDFRVSKSFSMGPLVGMTVGQYSSATVSLGGSSLSIDIPDKSIHMWMNVGVRGVFSLPLQ